MRRSGIHGMVFLMGMVMSSTLAAQTPSMHSQLRTTPAELSFTNDVIPFQDSIAMLPYRNVERSAVSGPSGSGSGVQEVSITRDALPVRGDGIPSAVKRTATTASAKTPIASVVLPPVNAIPVDHLLPMAPKEAVRSDDQ
ncbi:MAG: hypothetical protein IPH63_15775 [Flavobacteriales bacterium]|nr:hypothetical protein [Flavobacteriales bacterium]